MFSSHVSTRRGIPPVAAAAEESMASSQLLRPVDTASMAETSMYAPEMGSTQLTDVQVSAEMSSCPVSGSQTMPLM